MRFTYVAMMAVISTSQAVQLASPVEVQTQEKVLRGSDIAASVEIMSHGREEDSKVEAAEKVLDSYANSFDRFDNDAVDG